MARDSNTYRGARRNEYYATVTKGFKIKIKRRLRRGNKDLVNFASSIVPEKEAKARML